MVYLGNTKRCSKCKKYKPFSEYYKGKDRYGIRNRCKECEQRRKYRSREDRFWKFFWSRVVRVGQCLEWTGSYNSNGWAHCQYNNKTVGVRRLVYQLAVGELSDNTFVLSTCGNSRCVSQNHLRLGTAEDLEVKRVTNTAVGDEHYARTHPEKLARGDRHGSKLHPERVARGDRHSSRTHPERLARGDRHGSKTHPERLTRGDRHWMKIHPEQVLKGDKHPRSKLNEEAVRQIRIRSASGEPSHIIAVDFNISSSTVRKVLNGETWKHVQ